jgi:hypothetical protein
MIGQGVTEVKLHLRLVQIVIYPRMMRDDASPRIVPRKSAAAIGMTTTLSLKIGGVPEPGHLLHHDST